MEYNRNITVDSGCSRRGDSIFDTFAATANATSIDGEHYPAPINILLAQLLLNHVTAVVRARPSNYSGGATKD